MTTRLLILIALLLAALLAGCASSGANSASVPAPTPKPTPDTKYDWAFDEESTQEDDNPIDRVEINARAIEYATTAFPGWKIEGVATFAYTGNLYLVAVDLSQEQKRQTVNLVARRFFNSDRKAYWKVDPMTPEIGQALSGWTYHQYRKLKAENAKLEVQNDELESAQDDNAMGDEPVDVDPRH
jgi:hypothetical protein